MFRLFCSWTRCEFQFHPSGSRYLHSAVSPSPFGGSKLRQRQRQQQQGWGHCEKNRDQQGLPTLVTGECCSFFLYSHVIRLHRSHGWGIISSTWSPITRRMDPVHSPSRPRCIEYAHGCIAKPASTIHICSAGAGTCSCFLLQMRHRFVCIILQSANVSTGLCSRVRPSCAGM